MINDSDDWISRYDAFSRSDHRKAYNQFVAEQQESMPPNMKIGDIAAKCIELWRLCDAKEKCSLLLRARLTMADGLCESCGWPGGNYHEASDEFLCFQCILDGDGF